MTHLTRHVPWARLAAAGAALSTVVLTGCSGGTDADASATAPPSAGASSGSGTAGNTIGHQTQYVTQTSQPPSRELLRRMKHLPGVFLASYEPRDTQIRVFFSGNITKAERRQLEQQIDKMAP